MLCALHVFLKEWTCQSIVVEALNDSTLCRAFTASRLYELTGRGSQSGCCEPQLAPSCQEGTQYPRRIVNLKPDRGQSESAYLASVNRNDEEAKQALSSSKGSGGLSGHRKTLRQSLSPTPHSLFQFAFQLHV